MGREPGAGAMSELEGRAEALAGTFKAQEVANTLWAYATMGQEPGAGLMRGLEGRAEALAGTFNAQDVANTLWAYARMGREPGAGLRYSLEERILQVLADFTSQGGFNTRWAYSHLGFFLPAEVESCFAARHNAHVASSSDSVAAEAGCGDPPEAHCDAQSGTESALRNHVAESVASAGTTLIAMSTVSRSTDLSKASTVIAGTDSHKKYILPGLRKDMKEEAARKERGQDCRGGGWRGGGNDRWGDRHGGRGGGGDRGDRGGGRGGGRWGDRGGGRLGDSSGGRDGDRFRDGDRWGGGGAFRNDPQTKGIELTKQGGDTPNRPQLGASSKTGQNFSTVFTPTRTPTSARNKAAAATKNPFSLLEEGENDD